MLRVGWGQYEKKGGYARKANRREMLQTGRGRGVIGKGVKLGAEGM